MKAHRLLTIPGYAAAAIVWLAAVPLWLPAALLIDACRGGPRVATRSGVLAAAYLSYEVAGLACCAGLWVWGVFARPDSRRWQALHFRLETWWGTGIFRAIVRIFRLRIVIEGAEEARAGRAPLLVLVRHSSMADTLLAFALLCGPERIRPRYVLKRELLWDPCIDVVGNRLPNAFVDRRTRDPASEVARIGQLARDLGPRDGVVIYPEGTRFTPERRARILERLTASGEPGALDAARSLKSTLPPRPGGTIALLEAAPEADVLLVMHTGFEGSASPLDVWRGALLDRTIQVRFRRIPRREIPFENDARAAWLLEQWRLVDEWVTRHSEGTRRGEAPDEGEAMIGAMRPQADFTVLYDGDCPLCTREIEMLRRRDDGRGRLATLDIAAPDFSPARYGRDLETLMGRIHGVLPDGTLVEGVEVFRRAYAAVGLGWAVGWTRWPGLRPLVDRAYRWFARNRLRLTGREREVCATDRCAVSESRRQGT